MLQKQPVIHIDHNKLKSKIENSGLSSSSKINKRKVMKLHLFALDKYLERYKTKFYCLSVYFSIKYSLYLILFINY